MRIVAGELGGRQLIAPASATRPMTDRAREALYNTLGSVADMRMLDAYAGSGAVGFEAISRGALSVEAVEANRQAAAVIETNRASLGISFGYSLRQMTVETWLATPANIEAGPRYDVIVADPPYDKLDEEVLERLAGLLLSGGFLIVSHASRHGAPALRGTKLIKSAKYGDSTLSFYEPA